MYTYLPCIRMLIAFDFAVGTDFEYVQTGVFHYPSSNLQVHAAVDRSFLPHFSRVWDGFSANFGTLSICDFQVLLWGMLDLDRKGFQHAFRRCKTLHSKNVANLSSKLDAFNKNLEQFGKSLIRRTGPSLLS